MIYYYINGWIGLDDDFGGREKEGADLGGD